MTVLVGSNLSFTVTEIIWDYPRVVTITEVTVKPSSTVMGFVMQNRSCITSLMFNSLTAHDQYTTNDYSHQVHHDGDENLSKVTYNDCHW